MSRTVSWRAQKGRLLSTGWQQTFFFLLYVFNVYIMTLLSEGTETFMNFRYDLHNIFCRALAFYELYFRRVAITLVYNQHTYFYFSSQQQRYVGLNINGEKTRWELERDGGSMERDTRKKGDVERDTESSRRKNQAEVILEREEDV